MALNALLEGRIDRYLADNADQPGALWYFLHIPKTAGSSFREELASRLKPQANIHVDRKHADLPHRERLVAAVNEFIAGDERGACRFASGHVPRMLARPIFERRGRALRLVTMLRDPVERVISDFRYQRTPAHGEREAALKRFPTFESYVRTPGTQNKMYKFLRERADASADEVIASIEASFAFVGLTEQYDWSLALLFRLLGVDAKPTVYARKTESTADNEIPDLARWRPIVRELNALDVRIYEHFSARLAAARGQPA